MNVISRKLLTCFLLGSLGCRSTPRGADKSISPSRIRDSVDTNDQRRSQRDLQRLKEKLGPLWIREYMGPHLERTLSSYATRYKIFDEGTSNRTMRSRLQDHEIFLAGLFSKTFPGYQSFLRNQIFSGVRTALYQENKARISETMFIDIGPGLANPEGLPGITMIEIARRFPNLDIVGIDRKKVVEIFLGKRSGLWKTGAKQSHRRSRSYRVSKKQRNALLKLPNIHILAGNGLQSIRRQYKDLSTNPTKKRRPNLKDKRVLILRNANATEIYCDWISQKKCGASNRRAIVQLTEDFLKFGILYFYNRTIMIKKPHDRLWLELGVTSNRGFNHRTRTLTRQGDPPFTMFIKNTI